MSAAIRTARLINRLGAAAHSAKGLCASTNGKAVLNVVFEGGFVPFAVVDVLGFVGAGGADVPGRSTRGYEFGFSTFSLHVSCLRHA